MPQTASKWPNTADDADRKLFLLRIAQGWVNLADQIETERRSRTTGSRVPGVDAGTRRDGSPPRYTAISARKRFRAGTAAAIFRSWPTHEQSPHAMHQQAEQADIQDAVFKLLPSAEIHGLDEDGTERSGASIPIPPSFSRRRSCLQGQARGEISVSRLFDLGQAQGRLRRRTRINRAFAPQLYRRIVPITREASARCAWTAPASPWNGPSR